MGVDTALSMAISGEECARLATIDNIQELVPYVASNTSAGTGRKCGISDWRSTGMGYGYQPAVFPGDSFTLTFSLDGTNGYTGSGYCEQVDIIIDVEKGGYIENAVHASRNGALTVGAAAATDTTIPDPPCVQSLSVKLDTTAQDDVRFMHLMMRCPGKKYVSSDTAGGRERKGTQYVVNVMVTVSGTLSWELKWMRCESVKQLADHESDECVSAEVKMSFDCSDGETLGWIINPADSTVWPF